MRRVDYEFADFLVAAWRLALPDQPLTVGFEVLDRALENMAKSLPMKFSGVLVFSETPVGRACQNLPTILQAAIDSHLIHVLPPSYRHYDVLITPSFAMDLLDDLDIDIQDALAFGRGLDQTLARPSHTR